MSQPSSRRLIAALTALALVVAACGSDDPDDTVAATTEATATTEAPTTTDTEAEPEPEPAEVEPGPSSVSASDQSSDGVTLVADSVTLGAPGFLTVHADADGAPGPIIGFNPTLLPAGEHNDVVVELSEPLTESSVIWFMPHLDADGDGAYLFTADEPVDGPALTADDDVAVVPVSVTVE